MTALNATHDPKRRSWVASANDAATDFPIQNLPFGRFSTGPEQAPRIGVAIGNAVLDLRAAGLIDTGDMNLLMAQSATQRSALRARISHGLSEGSAQTVCSTLRAPARKYPGVAASLAARPR